MANYCNSKYTAENAELLISKELWVTPDLLTGEDAVLNSEHMGLANEAIMLNHIKKSDIAFLSLCTATRPYSKSFKYKTFISNFGDKVDFIINSNGGVVPIEYETSYPFMTYNAKRKNKKFDELYYQTLCKRVYSFLEKFRYDYVVANFQPDQRNYRYATDVLNYALSNGVIKGYRFTPSAKLRTYYKTVDKTYHQKLNPDTHPLIIEDILDAVNNPNLGAVI